MEPKFILSQKKVLEQYEKVKKLGKVSFSLKTNYEVGKIIEEKTEALISVSTLEELERVKDKSRVIFFLQGNTKEQIKKLLNQEIKYFVADNINDLNNIKEINPKNITLFLRMKLQEQTLHTSKYFVFGFTSEGIIKEINQISSNNINLGIHFHRKTQNLAEWNLINSIEPIKKILPKIKIICIGGGIPSEYKNTNPSKETINNIFNKIKEFKKYINTELILEPGRFISAPSVKLKTQIINIYNNTVVINCSVYNSMLDAIIYPLKPLIEEENETGEQYAIKGNTPCSLDMFRYRVKLKSPKIGDKITFLNAGAYNFYSDFCSLKKPKTIIED